jgi:drug/metabolite transporter (DMT)-like permease
VSDFVGGVMSRRLPLLAVLTISQTGGLVVIALTVAMSGRAAPSAGFVPYAALAGAGGLAGLAAFYRALAIGKMGVVAPISSMAVLVPVVVGLATGDRPSGVQYVGGVVGIAGIVLASRERSEDASAGSRVAAGVWLSLLSGLGFGIFFVAMDVAADYDPLWAAFANRASSLSLGWFAVLAFRPSFRPVGRADLPVLFSMGALEMAANVAFAFAATEGLLSLTAILASLYPVVTLLIARAVLHERLQPTQKAGVVGALAGAALIASG